MKKDFHGFYKPTNEEFDFIWTNATIVVDANILLNLYTYSESTSREILELLSEFRERLWVPHQVALEYHENRRGIILKESKRYADILTELTEVGRALRARKRHPYVTSELAKKFEAIETEIKVDLENGEQKHRELLVADHICDKVTELFDGRVGPTTDDERLNEIYKDGATRYERKVPPGYCDVKKPEPERYGDLLLWHQLMEYGHSSKKPMIFVTDDVKEDWWELAASQRVGPRPELRHEFRRETAQDVYIYSTDTFVDTAKKRGKKLSESAVEEIETASKERQQSDADALASEQYSQAFENAVRDTLERLPLASRGAILDSIDRLSLLLREPTNGRSLAARELNLTDQQLSGLMRFAEDCGNASWDVGGNAKAHPVEEPKNLDEGLGPGTSNSSQKNR